MKKSTAEIESAQNLKLESLIISAEELFASKGFRQCGVQEISEHLGLSKGGFYWHFESKDDLYCQVCKAHCTRCRKAFYELIEAPGPVDPKAIFEASRNLLDWFISNPKEIHLMFDFLQEIKSERVLAQIVELSMEWQRVLVILIGRCMAQGLVVSKGDPESLARMTLIFFRGLLMDFNVRHDRGSVLNDWKLFADNLFGLDK